MALVWESCCGRCAEPALVWFKVGVNIFLSYGCWRPSRPSMPVGSGTVAAATNVRSFGARGAKLRTACAKNCPSWTVHSPPPEPCQLGRSGWAVGIDAVIWPLGPKKAPPWVLPPASPNLSWAERLASLGKELVAPDSWERDIDEQVDEPRESGRDDAYGDWLSR
jgi:hypothetical protein